MTMESLTISPTHLDAELQCSKDVRTKPSNQSHLFVRGPIPLWWIQCASKECGQSAVILGMILFFWLGLKRKPAPISKQEIQKWGLSRNTRDSAQKKLLSARLITMHPLGKRRFPILDLTTRKPPSNNKSASPSSPLQKTFYPAPLEKSHKPTTIVEEDFLRMFAST
jgi:hypothetical protein